MEATTGWRFVVEELERIGADVHLAEPAEASALKGKKKRAKTDWQLDISLQVIDTLDTRLVPFDRELRAIARKQPGARALIDAIYGVGELTAITIIAELGDTRRFQNSRDVVRYAGLDITVYQSDSTARPGICPATARQRCAGRCMKQPNAPGSRPVPTDRTTSSSPPGSAGTVRASRSRASCSNAATTSSKTSATRRSRPSPDPPVARQAQHHTMNRGQLPARLLPTLTRGRPRKNERPHTICRNTPSHIMSPTRSQPGPSAEVSPGVRGHTPTPQRAHGPPAFEPRDPKPTNPAG